MTDANPVGPIVKHCQCCGRAFSLQAWRALPLVGYMDDGVERIELRNCTCLTRGLVPTLAITVDTNNEPCDPKPDP